MSERPERRTIDASVGEMLRRYRDTRRWSYRQAGRETGVAFGFLAMLEAGKRAPSVVVADLLVERYRMSGRDAAALRAVAVEGVGRDWRPANRDAAATTDGERRRPRRPY